MVLVVVVVIFPYHVPRNRHPLEIATHWKPPPIGNRYSLAGNRHPLENATHWLETATKQSDSWWQYWRDWLHARGGKRKPAPAVLGNESYPALEPAPGTYVHER